MARPEDQQSPAAAPEGNKAPKFISRSTWAYFAAAVISASLLGWTRGGAVLMRALQDALFLIGSIAPNILMGLMLGGLARKLVDPARVAPILGQQSGWRGLILATALGVVTPGGPFAAFPIVYALYIAGADAGAVIAYLTAWCLLGVQRTVVWELPLFGPEFVLTRAVVVLPLIVIAGAVARKLAVGALALRRPDGIEAGGDPR